MLKKKKKTGLRSKQHWVALDNQGLMRTPSIRGRANYKAQGVEEEAPEREWPPPWFGPGPALSITNGSMWKKGHCLSVPPSLAFAWERTDGAKAEMLQCALPHCADSQDWRGIFFGGSQPNISLRQLLCQEDNTVRLWDATAPWNLLSRMGSCSSFPIHPIH